jgi:RNA polymerase sigma-70 factor (ECF subfamily)
LNEEETGDAIDAGLAAKAEAGDQRAFAELMARHKAWLYRFIRRHQPDAEEAYDVLQETFASAWAALKRYDPERPFHIWIRRIALNKCRDRARKALVRRALFGAARHGGDALPEPVDPGPRADAQAAANEALGRLEKAIASLPRQLREPLVMTALEGLSQKEAAEVLKVGVKVVETRIYRARKQLAAVLDREDIGEVGEG